MQKELITRAQTLFNQGAISRVMGWQRGEFSYDVTPASFSTLEALERGFVYNAFCGANLSKFLIKESEKPGKIAVFLKPCDSYSLAQLCKEHRVKRENILAIGVPCGGKLSVEQLRTAGVDGILDIQVDGDLLRVDTLYGEKTMPIQEALPERCRNCKSGSHVGCDEVLGEEIAHDGTGRFGRVAEIAAMDPAARFAFWQGELSRCLRCNACRNVCPACSCEQCVFDSDTSGVASKASADPFEDQLYHIIRAFHVAGRCTDCGECSRVCPQQIPLHLLNRKLISDTNALYGDYQAGADPDSRPPMLAFAKSDPEPGEKGGVAG